MALRMNGPRDPSAHKRRSTRRSGVRVIVLALTSLLTNAMRGGTRFELSGRAAWGQTPQVETRAETDAEACVREAREDAYRRIQVNDIVCVMYDKDAPSSIKTFTPSPTEKSPEQGALADRPDAPAQPYFSFNFRPTKRVQETTDRDYWVGIVRKSHIQGNHNESNTLAIHHIDGWLRSPRSTDGMFVTPSGDVEPLKRDLYEIFSRSQTYNCEVTRGGWDDRVKMGGYFFEEDPTYAEQAKRGMFDHYVKIVSVNDVGEATSSDGTIVEKIMVQGDQKMHSYAMDSIDTANANLSKYWGLGIEHTEHSDRLRVASALNGDFPFAIENQKVVESLIGRATIGRASDDEPTLEQELGEYRNYQKRVIAKGGSVSEYGVPQRADYLSQAQKLGTQSFDDEVERVARAVREQNNALKMEKAAAAAAKAEASKDDKKRRMVELRAKWAADRALAADPKYVAAQANAKAATTHYEQACTAFDKALMMNGMQTLVVGDNAKINITRDPTFPLKGGELEEIKDELHCPMQCNFLSLSALNIVILAAKKEKGDKIRQMMLGQAKGFDDRFEKDMNIPEDLPAQYKLAMAAMRNEVANPHDSNKPLVSEANYLNDLLKNRRTPLIISASLDSAKGSVRKEYIEGSDAVRQQSAPLGRGRGSARGW